MTITIDRTQTTDFDVLIVGAGISGIGAAAQLAARRPGTSFAVLEAREAVGGTWDLFRYPGIRSDSDMHTFGYGFHPWTRAEAIVSGGDILAYLRDTVTEYGLQDRIRLGQRVTAAEFSCAEQRWTVTTESVATGETTRLTARFLFLGTGFYDYENGFTPEFAGVDDFVGRIVHPQQWPEDLDYTGQRVVVIGSGATAVTLIPAMAGRAAHVTMLQRSPSYVFSLPATDPIASLLERVLGPSRAYAIVRRKNIMVTRAMFKACRRAPKLMRALLIAGVRRRLPRHFDVDTHFSPRYNPWEQRLCMVPDGDLFQAISSGRASVVTDRITRFTETGLLLESHRHLDADIVVTATGLRMTPFGKIALTVDGRVVDPSATTVFKSMMLSGVPNLAFSLGYTNISWTLKVDLVCEHFCRLLDYMDAHGYATIEAVQADPHLPRVPLMDLSSGYVQRGISAFPHAGTRGPWTAEMAYEQDVTRLRDGAVEDPALRFTPARSGRPVSRSERRR
ncbi:flavin-containing monooxygenase [Nocardia nepalensis]|uniref:flavin-containing monooxygenase n=1 Tax=Nocardia nepalensis TaxID=3375448 RepID=UPI003B6825A4